MVTSTSTSSVSGLASGLDTAGIISQLMAIAARPQNVLKASLNTTQSTITSLQSLNSQVLALATLAKAGSTAASWAPQSVTSSLAGVTATSTGTGGASVDLHVVQAASAARTTYGTTVAPTAVVTSGGPVTLTVGTTTSPPLDLGDGTLASLVRTINAGSYGVTATTVSQSDGTQRLMLQAGSTGAQTISLTGVDGLGTATATAGQDAKIIVGADTLSSPSNTFTAVSGLSITVSAAAAGQDASIGVVSDAASAEKQAKAMVDSVNALLSQIDAASGYNAASKSQGALAGDHAVGSLRTDLFNSVFPPDATSLSGYGIQTDRYGMLVFDPTAFEAAYAKDPGAVAGALGGTNGFAARVGAVATAASDPLTGSLTTSVKARTAEIQRTQKSIADWDDRLSLKQSALTVTYTSLETALSKLQNQQTWLTSQLNALNPTKSG